MKEVSKPNDILVSTILNPMADASDLIASGINGANTELLYPEDYKKSKFILRAFTDQNGVFDNSAFEKAYLLAAQKQNELMSIKTFSDLSNLVTYNENDIFAPINSNKTPKEYNIEKVRNPFRVTEGISSIYGKGEATQSRRELAQQHKVWDSVNQKWLDYTAEDLGVFGLKYLFGQSLVYATWDNDGIHFDKALGRLVKHKKGEWRTDDDGQFFTETIGNKLGYGKEYVAYSDILTKEGSWLNNIDFFDSDDIRKSKTGTILKTLAVITPYLITDVREVWGATTAAIAMSAVLPTFAKMAEGIAIGDGETEFTRKMNTLENYWKKFSPSYSDEAKQSMINFETVMETVGDVFGLLYLMKAAASLSNLYTKSLTKAQSRSAEQFAKKFGSLWTAMKSANPTIFEKNPNAFVDLWRDLASKTPEMKAIIDKQTALSRSLSLGYMSLISSADVYEDALLGGYDRRMAGFAGLIAAAGLYGIMRNNKLGTWFLDATTGYKENVSRNVMRQTLRPYYDLIDQAAKKLVIETAKDAKLGIVASTFNKVFKLWPKKYFDIIRYGSEDFWKRALIEGTEEVTEEAVMDTTKGIFDFLSSVGVGKNAATASFGGFDNVFSAEGAQRYLMNFVGGVLGGALFEFLGNVWNPFVDSVISNKAMPEARYSIVREIMNGNTQELLDEIDRMTRNDTDLVSLTGDNEAQTSRGEIINQVLKNYVKFVEGIIVDNGIRVEDDQILDKVVRDRMLQPIIEESGLLDVIKADFTKMTDELIGLSARYQQANTSTNDKEGKEGEEYNVNSSEASELKQQITEKKLQLADFLNGKNTKDYLKMALLYLQPNLRSAVLEADKYSWAKSVYGVDYSTLPQTDATLSKSQIDREYAEWKEKSNEFEKFRYIGVNAFDELEKEFSQIFEEYANSQYKDVRKVTLESLLRDVNFNLGDLIQNQNWRETLLLISQALHNAGLPGINLEDKLQISEEFKQKLKDNLLQMNEDYFTKAAKVLKEQSEKAHAQWEELPEEQRKLLKEPEVKDLTAEDIKNLFETNLNNLLQNLPVEQLSADVLNNELVESNYEIATAFVQGIVELLGDQVDAAILKQAIDAELVRMGISPEEGVLDGDPVLSAIQYVADRTIVPVDQNFNPSESLLESYFEKQQVIDNEIVRQIKSSILRALQSKKNEFFQAIDIVDEGIEIADANGSSVLVKCKLKDKTSAFELFITRVQQGLDNNEAIEDIVEDALFNSMSGIVDLQSDSYKALIEINPNANKEVKDAVVELINSLPGTSLYNLARTKESSNNPLFDKLRQFGMKVFDGDDMILFDLLESESNHMSQLPDLSEYLRQGVTKEAIDNFILKLELLKAIVIGMENTGIDPDHQVAFNIQMKRFAEKWDEGRDVEKYKTISTENVALITKDLDLLINKLLFTKTLIETNTESKDKANQETKEKLEKILLDTLEQAGTLTIKGVSIYTPVDKLESTLSDSLKLGIIEHDIYTSIQQLLKNGEKIDKILDELFIKLQINKDVILQSGLSSNGLNSSIKTISPYDFFVWVVTAASSDSHEFLYKYKNILNKDAYKHVPFFIQEYAAKTLYSFANDKSKVHSTAVQWLYKGVENPQVQKASQIFFLNGIAGSGKTTAVMSLVASMLNVDNIIIAAPNKSPQAENFANSLSTNVAIADTTPVLGKQELLSRFFNQDFLDKLFGEPNETILSEVELEDPNMHKKYSIYNALVDESCLKNLKIEDVPSIIFIDEATHFNLIELKALDILAKKYNIKIIAAGDTLQKGATINGLSCNINDIYTWKSPAMLISVRASNIHKKDNTDKLQSLLRRIEQIFITDGYNLKDKDVHTLLTDSKELTYYQTSSDLQGDKLVSEITVDDLKVIKAAADGKSVAVIDTLDNNGQPSSDLITKLKDAGIKDYTVYSIDDFSDRTVQGAEADYVIINNMPPVTMDNYQNLVNLYTYLTRSLIGSLVKIGDYQKQLNLVNNAVSYTSSYAMPGIDKQATKKQERVTEIDQIIKDYKPEEPQTKPKPKEANAPVIQEQKESDLTDDQLSEVQRATAEGEVADAPGNLEILNPVKWVPESLYGYSFYNRTGISQDAHRRFFSRNFGTSMDLDGLFGEERRGVSKEVVRGFIKFKNLIALYGSDVETIKENLDSDILKFFYKTNPGITESKDEEDQLADVENWIKNNLQISGDIYIFAKRYNKEVDATALTPEGDADALKDGKDLWVGFGRKLTVADENGNIIINQYITTGVLPKKETLTELNIVSPEYDTFLQLANDAVNKSGKTEIFVLPKGSTIDTTIGLEIRKAEDPNRFVTLRAMQDDYGIHFEQNVNGEPNVMLIDSHKSTINGVTTFNILHKIALTEESPLSYAERIAQLEKAFVKDGKLTISGKYFVVASFTTANDNKFKRVLILEPGGHTYLNALDLLRKEAHKLYDESSDNLKKSNVLERKAKAMSQASQMRLLTATFKALHCLDENGLAIGDGVLPYVEYTADYLDATFNDKTIPQKMKELINRYKEQGLDFDMSFISEVLKATRYGGIILIDQHLAVGKDSVTAKQLPEPGNARRATVDIDFDFDSMSYREFGADFTKSTTTATTSEGTIDLTFTNVLLNEGDYDYLGLSGHFLNMPKFNFTTEMIAGARRLSQIEAKLTHKAIDYSSDTSTKEEKVSPTTESFKELKKRFNPEIDIRRSLPGTRFYHMVRMSKEEAAQRGKFTTSVKDTNGFQIRVGDTIQIYGDTTHTYHISWVDKAHKRFEYDIKDGNEVGGIKQDKYIPFDAVSAIVGREVGKFFMTKDKDFYQSDSWKQTVQASKQSKTKASKIISINNLSNAKIEELLKKNPALVIYPVVNSDATVLTKLLTAEDALEDGTDLTSVGIYLVTSVEGVKETVERLSEETDDLNGIVIVGLFEDSVNKFATNRKEVIKGITEGYIRQYISVTDFPKYNEVSKPKEELTTSKPKVEKQKSRLEAVIESINNTSSLESLDEVVADTREELSDFGNTQWFKYQGEDGKWHITPKRKLIDQLEPSVKSSILTSIPKVPLNIGEEIRVVKDDGTGENIYTLSEIAEDSYKFTYTVNDKTYPTSIKKSDFELLYDKKYFKTGVAHEQPVTINPVLTETTLPQVLNAMFLRFQDKYKVLSDEFAVNSQRIFEGLQQVRANVTKAQVDTALADFLILAILRLLANGSSFEEIQQLWSINDSEDLETMIDEINYILSHNEQISDLYDENMIRNSDC